MTKPDLRAPLQALSLLTFVTVALAQVEVFSAMRATLLGDFATPILILLASVIAVLSLRGTRGGTLASVLHFGWGVVAFAGAMRAFTDRQIFRLEAPRDVVIGAGVGLLAWTILEFMTWCAFRRARLSANDGTPFGPKRNDHRDDPQN